MGEMEINDCWSLLAVVKECARKARLRALEATTPDVVVTNAAPSSTTTTRSTTNVVGKDDSYWWQEAAFASNELFDSRNDSDELVDLCKPFLLSSSADAIKSVSSVPTHTNKVHQIGGVTKKIPHQDHNQHQPPPSPEQQAPLQQRSLQVRKLGSCAIGHPCIHKKKKFEERRVCRISVEELSNNDKWAWRKYGQKPIKGSPYPRNYYRCSSSKGCSARKQVEQSPGDPNIYLITYTGQHHHPRPAHRISGGTRVKIPTAFSPERESPATGTADSDKVVVKMEECDDEERDDVGGYDKIVISNLMKKEERDDDSEMVLMGKMEQLMMMNNKEDGGGGIFFW